MLEGEQTKEPKLERGPIGRELWQEKIAELKNYKKNLHDHLEKIYGHDYSFRLHDLSLEIWNRLLTETGLKRNELLLFGAIHPIIDSTAIYEHSPDFDLPDGLIMKTFFEVYNREMGSSDN